MSEHQGCRTGQRLHSRVYMSRKDVTKRYSIQTAASFVTHDWMEAIFLRNTLSHTTGWKQYSSGILCHTRLDGSNIPQEYFVTHDWMEAIFLRNTLSHTTGWKQYSSGILDAINHRYFRVKSNAGVLALWFGITSNHQS